MNSLEYSPTLHVYGPLIARPGGPGVLERLTVKGRRDALTADHEAEFASANGEYVGYLPHVRMSPGPRGVRSVTMHAPSWEELLDALEELTGPAESAGPDAS